MKEDFYLRQNKISGGKNKAVSICLYVLSLLLAANVICNSLPLGDTAFTVSSVAAAAVFILLAFCRRLYFLALSSLVYQVMFVFFFASPDLSYSAKISALLIPVILIIFAVYDRKSDKKTEEEVAASKGKNGVVALALVAGTVISALLVCYAAYRITLVRRIDGGGISGNTYASEFGNFKYTLPDSWVFVDENQQNEIIRSGEVNYYGDGRLYFIARDIEGINSVYAELLDCGMWTSEDRVIRSMISSIDSNKGGLEYSESIERGSIKLGGREYSTASVTLSIGDGDNKINVYFIVSTSTRYALCFTVYSDGEFQLEDIAECFSEYSE